MYPAIGYDVASARLTDLRQQAQRDALARAARHRADRTRTQQAENYARCEALFASELQRSDAPDVGRVAKAIRATVAALWYRWLCQPDGAGVRRPPRGSRRAHALGPFAIRPVAK